MRTVRKTQEDATGGATFGPRRRYRYRLWRTWDVATPRVLFVLLNPSTAAERVNDPTIRRCIGFARIGRERDIAGFAFRQPIGRSGVRQGVTRLRDVRFFERARGRVGDQSENVGHASRVGTH